MIEGNTGDGRGDRFFDDVGGIESSTKTDFEYGAFGFCLVEGNDGGDESRFEKGEVEREGKGEGLGESIVIEGDLIDSNSFGETMKMRGGEQADPITGLLKGKGGDGGHASFAVGARDM